MSVNQGGFFCVCLVFCVKFCFPLFVVFLQTNSLLLLNDGSALPAEVNERIKMLK